MAVSTVEISAAWRPNIVELGRQAAAIRSAMLEFSLAYGAGYASSVMYRHLERELDKIGAELLRINELSMKEEA